jgi:hypothetical protein
VVEGIKCKGCGGFTGRRTALVGLTDMIAKFVTSKVGENAAHKLGADAPLDPSAVVFDKPREPEFMDTAVAWVASLAKLPCPNCGERKGWQSA